MKRKLSKVPKRGTCRKCGCTDKRGCRRGCAWTDSKHTLCTACATEKELDAMAKAFWGGTP